MKTFSKIFVVAGLFALTFILVSSGYAIVSDRSFFAAAGTVALWLFTALAFLTLFFSTWLTTTDGRRAALGL